MKYPVISIVTPCYNTSTYLEETILSVLDQNYPNLEYIIIDGGSSDNTIEIIKKYQDKLTYCISEKDNGMYDAIQKGFKKSTGEIMAWINADDMYHRKAFFTIAEIFSKFDCINWLTGAFTHWDEQGRCVNSGLSRKFNRYDFLIGDYKTIQQESTFWRRSLWEKAGSCVNTQLRYAGDFELWLRFFRFEQLYVTNALIGGFRIRSSNQLSLEGIHKYTEEVNNVLASEPITRKEKKIISRYKQFYNIIHFFAKFKIVNTNGIMNTYRKIKTGYVKDLEFNRKTQQFDMI